LISSFDFPLMKQLRPRVDVEILFADATGLALLRDATDSDLSSWFNIQLERWGHPVCNIVIQH
jgi:hypothetical protein